MVRIRIRATRFVTTEYVRVCDRAHFCACLIRLRYSISPPHTARVLYAQRKWGRVDPSPRARVRIHKMGCCARYAVPPRPRHPSRTTVKKTAPDNSLSILLRCFFVPSILPPPADTPRSTVNFFRGSSSEWLSRSNATTLVRSTAGVLADPVVARTNPSRD